MNVVKHYLTENPMKVEWELSRRRMLPKNWKAQNAIAYSIVGMIYLGLFYMVISAAAAVDPVYLFFAMIALTVFALPIVVHGSIAGERQARSLETLFAAPVTPGQIVAGKVIRALPTLVLIVGSIVVLMFFVGIVRVFQPDSYMSAANVTFATYMVGMVGEVSLAVFVTGIAIWISSVTRTTGAALLGTVGALIVVFAVVPSLIWPFFSLIDQQLPGMLFAGHPIGFFAWLIGPSEVIKESQTVFAWLGMVSWGLLGFGLLAAATRRLATERRTGVETR